MQIFFPENAKIIPPKNLQPFQKIKFLFVYLVSWKAGIPVYLYVSVSRKQPELRHCQAGVQQGGQPSSQKLTRLY